MESVCLHRMANQELEKELLEEKMKEEEMEAKIRTLRKERKKARLIKDKHIDDFSSQPPSKKTRTKEQEPRTSETTPRVNTIRLTNLRALDNNKVYEGETITNFDIENTDWDKVQADHKEKLGCAAMCTYNFYRVSVDFLYFR